MTASYPYVHVPVAADDAELVSLELWELGANGIEERDATTLNRPDAGAGSAITLVASFADAASAQAALEALAERFPDAHLATVEGDAWRDAYKAYFKPTRIGERLVIRPSWEAYEARPRDVVLTLDPGGAFGTGTHETTRLSLEELGRRVQPGMRVLDVGTGSGILSIACLLLGAERARAIDNDPEAVRAAQENAQSNGVADRLEAGEEPLSAIAERYPLVVANIERRVLVELAPALCERLQPGGVLILSGVLAHEREQVFAAYAGLRPLEVRELGEWVVLVLERDADGARAG